MWPWVMIVVGVVLVVGGLVARQRMLRDNRARLASVGATEPSSRQSSAAGSTSKSAPSPSPSSRATPKPTPAAAEAPVPFPDRPPSHRLTDPPMLRARSSDVPLLDWLRYYSDGNAWSGVIQSTSDRISGDPVLQPYFGAMDRATLQRHVMSTLRDLIGEGLTVGTLRRLADAHVTFVAAGGPPVSEPVWDKLAATCANALREHLVPEAAVLALDETIAPLRAVLVRPVHD